MGFGSFESSGLKRLGGLGFKSLGLGGLRFGGLGFQFR